MNPFAAQKQFFHTGKTLSVPFRLRQLRRLYRAIWENQKEISNALAADLGKSPAESYMAEIGFALHELRYTIRHLTEWAKPQRVPTPLIHQPAQSRLMREPYGVCLIISPWNYPFLLSITPLISAIAGGNCAVLKPSELSPHTAAVLKKLIAGCFPSWDVRTVTGGADRAAAETARPYDLIFFTGSQRVGRLVLEAAGKNLTPTVLELGGKSPCIVEPDVPLSTAARRIVWGKLLNAGQTCVAPDYLLVHQSIKGALVQELVRAAQGFYGSAPCQNPNYPRIISPLHFERLVGLITSTSEKQRLFGGNWDEKTQKISLSILDCGSVTHPTPALAMEEEIFGPILPILSYQSIEEAVRFLTKRPKPLALYLFTQNKGTQQRVMEKVSFGGGCINDTISHLATPYLPFGGVGASGMGAYHGRFGFEAFTHTKGILQKPMFPDIPLRYPPLENRLALLQKIWR